MNFTDKENEICINPEEIAGYIIRRSPTSRIHFNVYAINSCDDLLFCAASDLSAEKAFAFVGAINQEYYPVVPTPTEAAFVEVGGMDKVYNITTGR